MLGQNFSTYEMSRLLYLLRPRRRIRERTVAVVIRLLDAGVALALPALQGDARMILPHASARSEEKSASQERGD